MGVLRHRDQGGSCIVKHARRRRGASVGVHHHPERLAGGLDVTHGQVRIVCSLRPRSDHDRVAFSPEPVRVGAGLLAGNPLGGSVGGGDAPVHARPVLPGDLKPGHRGLAMRSSRRMRREPVACATSSARRVVAAACSRSPLAAYALASRARYTPRSRRWMVGRLASSRFRVGTVRSGRPRTSQHVARWIVTYKVDAPTVALPEGTTLHLTPLQQLLLLCGLAGLILGALSTLAGLHLVAHGASTSPRPRPPSSPTTSPRTTTPPSSRPSTSTSPAPLTGRPGRGASAYP